MYPQHIRLRTAPMIILAAIMVAASLIAASPAAAAKARPYAVVNCFQSFPAPTPGYPVPCAAFVLWDSGPAPTGTLKISASTYKGTLSTNTCNSTSCNFTYTPKGKGSDYRKDTITAVYSGDSNYYSARGSYKLPVAPAPTPVLNLSCPDSVQTGATAFCGLSFQVYGPALSTSIELKVSTYKGTVAPEECFTVFSSFCPVYYTPKGRGYDTRVDKITASHPGDLYNSPTKVTETIRVTAAP